jgi:hypothetical protein
VKLVYTNSIPVLGRHHLLVLQVEKFRPWMKRFNERFARASHFVELMICDREFYEKSVRQMFAGAI